MCVLVNACVCVWSQRTTLRNCAFLPPCGSWRFYSGCQAWQQKPLPTKLSCQPIIFTYGANYLFIGDFYDVRPTFYYPVLEFHARVFVCVAVCMCVCTCTCVWKSEDNNGYNFSSGAICLLFFWDKVKIGLDFWSVSPRDPSTCLHFPSTEITSVFVFSF